VSINQLVGINFKPQEHFLNKKIDNMQVSVTNLNPVIFYTLLCETKNNNFSKTLPHLHT